MTEQKKTDPEVQVLKNQVEQFKSQVEQAKNEIQALDSSYMDLIRQNHQLKTSSINLTGQLSKFVQELQTKDEEIARLTKLLDNKNVDEDKASLEAKSNSEAA